MTKECQNCGAFVDDRFGRVLGDRQHNVHACPECSTQKERFAGATAGRTL